MRIVLTTISIAAALIMINVSAALNYTFLASFGRTSIESVIFGSAGLAADIIKACLPWFAVLAWESRRFVFVVVATAVFALLSIASLAAAVGFGAELRGQSAQERKQISAALTDLQRQKARLQAQLSANGTHRTGEVIRAQIAGLKQHGSWSSSKQCSNVTLPRSRRLCGKYHRAVAELHAAEAGRRLDHDLQRLSARIHKLQGHGAGAADEPQVIFLARLFDQEIGSVRSILILLTALVIEFGSGLGLYLAMHHSSGNELIAHEMIGRSKVDSGSGETQLAGAACSSELAVERFCIEHIAPNPSSSVPTDVIYARFRIWCAANEFDEPTRSEFTNDFSQLAEELGLRSDAGAYKDIKIVEH